MEQSLSVKPANRIILDLKLKIIVDFLYHNQIM